MSEWIKVDSFADLPVGDWLVQVDRPIFGTLVLHTAAIRENVGVIAGLFPCDQRRVIAYRSLPDPAPDNLNSPETK